MALSADEDDFATRLHMIDNMPHQGEIFAQSIRIELVYQDELWIFLAVCSLVVLMAESATLVLLALYARMVKRLRKID